MDEEWIKAEVERLFEPYVALYDGPNEHDIEALLRKAFAVAYKAAINVTVLTGPPGSEIFRDRLIERFRARLAQLEQGAK